MSVYATVQARKLAEVERGRRQEAERAEDDAEHALARSLVRPLNQQGGDSLSEPEAEALWELARKPGDRFWWRFVAEATRTPLAASQLRGRAEPVWIAVVGLDQERHDRAVGLLHERLRAEGLSAQHRFDLAVAAAILGDMAGIDSQRIADLLLEMLTGKDTTVDRTQVRRTVVDAAQGLDAAAAAHVLTQALEKETDALGRLSLAEGLASLFSRMNDVDAIPLVRNVVYVICSRRNLHCRDKCTGSLHALTGLDELLSASNPSEVRRRAATASGLSATSPLHSLAALAGAVEPLPYRLSTQDLVELLKMPTCWGEARKVVLKHLGNRYGRPFANHWEFVRFAREHHLDLDFTSPPQRPERP
jgi:hypothetical protein